MYSNHPTSWNPLYPLQPFYTNRMLSKVHAFAEVSFCSLDLQGVQKKWDITSIPGGAQGGSFRSLSIECAQGDQPAQCPNRVILFALAFRRSVWWWLVVFLWSVEGGGVMCCHVVGCEVRWSNVVGCEVTWGEVMWLVARRHVMSCDAMWCGVMSCHVMSCHVVWCDGIFYVLSCHLMSCDAPMWCDVIWCEVMGCIGMGCYALVMRCPMWLVVRSCYVIRNGCVMWSIRRWCAVNCAKLMFYSTTTPYFKVLLHPSKYYPVLQITTKYCSVLPKTTPHYKVRLRSTKYSTTKYYSVLQWDAKHNRTASPHTWCIYMIFPTSFCKSMRKWTRSRGQHPPI